MNEWKIAALLLAAANIASVFVVVQHQNGNPSDEWQSGYHFGWWDGCSHFYDLHGWVNGKGCGPPEYKQLESTTYLCAPGPIEGPCKPEHLLWSRIAYNATGTKLIESYTVDSTSSAPTKGMHIAADCFTTQAMNGTVLSHQGPSQCSIWGWPFWKATP